jgi:G3E family GTPase
MYLKNFGEFFLDQVKVADTILLSRTDKASAEKVQQVVELLRQHNDHAVIVTTPWTQLDGKELLQEIEQHADLAAQLLAEVQHEQHHHVHGDACGCDHQHHEHEAHHHEHGETCGYGEHHHEHTHHHAQGEVCSCGHDHHADEVFVSWGMETPNVYEAAQLEKMLQSLGDLFTYGTVLRAKGMLPAADGTWLYFDYVPGEWQVRLGKPAVTGKICVIGSDLQQDALQQLFQA